MFVPPPFVPEISAWEPQVVHRMCVAKMHFRVNQHIEPHLEDGIGDSVEGRTTRVATWELSGGEAFLQRKRRKVPGCLIESTVH